MASLSNINSYFLTRRNQFENNIFARFWTTDPFAGLIESKPFELEMGLTPTVVTATHELPTSYLPLTQTALTLSAGTGNAACTPGVINIGGGYITRNFTINVNAFQTEAFCLTDLQFKFQWEQQARFREKGLGDFVTQYQGDWARVNNIGQVNTKVMPLGPGLYAESDNDANFSFVNLAPYVGQCGVLDWTMLANFYDRLNQIGAQQNSVGMSDGTPVYALNIGPGLKRRLFQTTSFIRTSVDFNDMGKEFSRNFLARGIDTAINGFLPNVDLNAIRYDAGFNPIYPYVNNAVTQGTQAQPNANYRTVALGGKAVSRASTRSRTRARSAGSTTRTCRRTSWVTTACTGSTSSRPRCPSSLSWRSRESVSRSTAPDRLASWFGVRVYLGARTPCRGPHS